MNLTAADLTRILQQPGYTIADGSLLPECAQAAQDGRGEALPPKPTKGTQRGSKSAWRSEREFQRAVMDAFAVWAAANRVDSILCHIANENAHRQPGIVAGMPDIVLLKSSRRFGALFIELKVGSGKCSKAQLDMHYRLLRLGYSVIVVWDSVDEVMRAIAGYVGLEKQWP